MKRVTVIFSSSAIGDVEQAVAYYEEKRAVLRQYLLKNKEFLVLK